jgi:mannose/fructose/N-acetylgalactosamine-specific phosphotransferase system component IID
MEDLFAGVGPLGRTHLSGSLFKKTVEVHLIIMMVVVLAFVLDKISINHSLT